MFWDQNCDVQKNLGPIFFKNKNCVPIILGWKDKVRKQKKNGAKKFWSKKMLDQKSFGALVPKSFGAWKILGLKCFGA